MEPSFVFVEDRCSVSTSYIYKKSYLIIFNKEATEPSFTNVIHPITCCACLKPEPDIQCQWSWFLCSNDHHGMIIRRRVWRNQSGNQNPYIEEEQTTQWPNEKVQKDKQRSTKYTHKAKDRVTRTPLKPGGELRCSGGVGSSYSTGDTNIFYIDTLSKA